MSNASEIAIDKSVYSVSCDRGSLGLPVFTVAPAQYGVRASVVANATHANTGVENGTDAIRECGTGLNTIRGAAAACHDCGTSGQGETAQRARGSRRHRLARSNDLSRQLVGHARNRAQRFERRESRVRKARIRIHRDRRFDAAEYFVVHAE